MADPRDSQVALRLSRYEALVLFEWLVHVDAAEARLCLDPAEQKVLWLLEGQLEKALPEPLQPNYQDLVDEARREVRECYGTNGIVVTVSVVEPWDLESEAGPNLLRGWLVGDALELAGVSVRIVRVNREVRVGDKRGLYFVMRARHREEPLDGLMVGRKVPVHLGLIPGEGNWRERLGEATLVIAGTAELGEGDNDASDGSDDTEPLRLV